MQYTATQSSSYSWFELDKHALFGNVQTFRSALGSKTLLGCVLKGNAYGHGFVEILSLLHEKVDIIFVINPVDAYFIRKYESEKNSENKRIVVLGTLSEDEILECVKHNIELSAGGDYWNNPEFFKSLGTYLETHKDQKLKIHIHVDAGPGREGILIEEIEEKLTLVKQHLNLIEVVGVTSHFANVEDVTDQEYAKHQLNNLDVGYKKIVQFLELKHKPERHIAQSASSLVLREFQYDIARVGISMYGYWPSRETKISAKFVSQDLPKLQPILSWKVKSQLIKTLPSGSFIGYGCSHRCVHDTKIALLPVGYFDGYPRNVSSRAHVLVEGKRCRVLGRVMMNHIIVDISEISHNNPRVEAVLIGQSESETITVENIADWAGTINYEIVARLPPHIKRVII